VSEASLGVTRICVPSATSHRSAAAATLASGPLRKKRPRAEPAAG
jgi:hypothetical protein